MTAVLDEHALHEPRMHRFVMLGSLGLFACVIASVWGACRRAEIHTLRAMAAAATSSTDPRIVLIRCSALSPAMSEMT